VAHDWEALYARLETATESWSRPELVALLRDLIREYVIERGLPTGTPEQAAAPDLTAMDFPALVSYLKRTVRLPEMGLFTVDGRRVIVDIDGPRVIRATGTPPAARPTPAPQPASTPPSAGESRPAPPGGSHGEPSPGSGSRREPREGPPAADPAPPPAADRPLSNRFKKLEFD
jgi:hypothetical protein